MQFHVCPICQRTWMCNFWSTCPIFNTLPLQTLWHQVILMWMFYHSCVWCYPFLSQYFWIYHWWISTTLVNITCCWCWSRYNIQEHNLFVSLCICEPQCSNDSCQNSSSSICIIWHWLSAGHIYLGTYMHWHARCHKRLVITWLI